jgi:hypothetical protein
MKSKNSLLNETAQVSLIKEIGKCDIPEASVETTQLIQKYFIII